jgi:hypothetical protein
MRDTGEWRWAVPGILADVPEQVEALKKHELGREYTDEEIGSILGLGGFGVGGMRGGGAYPKQPGIGAPSVIGALGKQARLTRPRITTKSPSAGLPIGEEPGFFMGPFANPQNVPGVTLASGPQKGRMTAHSTSASEIYDVPKAGMNPEELGLHVSNHPDVFNIYSHPLNKGLLSEKFPVPRTYPMVQSLGGVLSRDRSGLTDLGPWNDPYILHAKYADNLMESGIIADDLSEAEMMDTLNSFIASESPELQGILGRLGQGEDPAKVFGQWPAVDFEHHPGSASMVMDPGTILPAFSEQGMLARRWNDIEPIQMPEGYAGGDAAKAARDLDILYEYREQMKKKRQ